MVTALGGTPGNGEKRRFLSRKSMILGVWGALGLVGRGPGTGEPSRTHFTPKNSPIWGPILGISGIFQGVFLSVFPGALCFRIVSVLGARGSPKGRFWETILKTFWG